MGSRRRMMKKKNEPSGTAYLKFTNAGLLTDIKITDIATLETIISFYAETWGTSNTAIFSIGVNVLVTRTAVRTGGYKFTSQRAIGTTTNQRATETYSATDLNTYSYFAIKIDCSQLQIGDGSYWEGSMFAPIALDADITNKFSGGGLGTNRNLNQVLRLFSNNAQGTLSSTNDRFYGLQMKEGGVITHNLIPFEKDGTPGVKDTVTGNFYGTVIGTGTVEYMEEE